MVEFVERQVALQVALTLESKPDERIMLVSMINIAYKNKDLLKINDLESILKFISNGAPHNIKKEIEYYISLLKTVCAYAHG